MEQSLVAFRGKVIVAFFPLCLQVLCDKQKVCVLSFKSSHVNNSYCLSLYRIFNIHYFICKFGYCVFFFLFGKIITRGGKNNQFCIRIFNRTILKVNFFFLPELVYISICFFMVGRQRRRGILSFMEKWTKPDHQK